MIDHDHDGAATDRAEHLDDTRLEELIDRAEITDVIGRYCYGMDSRDWALYRSCWTDDMVSAFLAASGAAEGTTIRADDFVDGLRTIFEDIPSTQHIKIPVAFEFDDKRSRARVLAVMQGKHWSPNRQGGALQTMVGYYDDLYVRTPDGWKMTALTEIAYWNEGNAAVLTAGQQRALAMYRQRYPHIDWERGIREVMAEGDSAETIIR